VRPAADAAFLLRALFAGRGRPPFPYKLTLAVTSRCNLRCEGCRIWEQPGRDLPLAAVRALFARSPRLSWVDVTGGELFLRDDLPELFAAVLDGAPRLALLHFPTNGSLPDRVEKVVRDLLRRRPPRLVVTVSVDGPPALHDRLRGAEGSFARAVETFRRLRALPGCRTLFGMTLSSANAGSVADTLAALRRAAPGVSPADLHLNLAHRSAHYYGNAELPESREGTGEALAGALNIRPFPLSPVAMAERRYLSLVPRYLASGRCPLPCRALAASCFVAPDGAVYPCVSWDRPLGKLADFDNDLGRVWESEAAVAARQEIAAGRCPGCWTPCEAVPAILARGWGFFG
jgi:Fe-coproporphyrin III synthase